MPEAPGWIKLHRKLRDHEIMRDHTALAVFLWMLMVCDDKGKGFFGRNSTARILNLPPSTFYWCTKRIEDRYDLCTTRRTGRCTYFTINKWESYQHGMNSSMNIPRTSREHKVRIKNKEYIYKNQKNEIPVVKFVETWKPEYAGMAAGPRKVN